MQFKSSNFSIVLVVSDIQNYTDFWDDDNTYREQFKVVVIVFLVEGESSNLSIVLVVSNIQLYTDIWSNDNTYRKRF